MRAFGFIFARGGSKGVPGKNIRLLAGKPLIAYAIEAGLATGKLEKIIVSTDSEDIAKVAREYGAETPFMRPAELATDHAPEWISWQHALQFFADQGIKIDAFVSLPATSPMRRISTVVACLDMLRKNPQALILTCCPAAKSPYFNMVTLDAEHNAQLGMKLPASNSSASTRHTTSLSSKEVRQVIDYAASQSNPDIPRPIYDPIPNRRQDAPAFYDITTVCYAASPQRILQTNGLWSGQVKAVIIDPIEAVDIDTPFDFTFAEFLKQQAKKKPKSDDPQQQGV